MGAWPLAPGTTLFIDRVARDPFAPPSRARLRVDGATAGFPSDLFANRVRRLALADLFARRLRDAFSTLPRSGSGKSGLVRVDAGGQEIVERTAVRIKLASPDELRFVEARIEVGLPARGRRILGRAAARLLAEELPGAASSALAFAPEGDPRNFVFSVENTEHLRRQLGARGLVAFVADGAVLPRAHGATETPLTDGAIPFASPPSLRVRLSLLHGEGGPTEVAGMGVPEGVTVIVGGGFHGKSTLLQALARGVYPHVPGDGRERVVTRPDAVTIRAEEGRAVRSVDISPFLRELPGGRDPASFTTDNASGSTSQAASIVEAIESGSRLLLLDEDTSATNLMIRDARMQALVRGDAEPIVPFLDRVRALYEERRISTVLVMGGSGDYFEVADTVIQLARYRPREVTEKARRVAARLPSQRVEEAGSLPAGFPDRHPHPASLDPAGRRGRPRIRASRHGILLYGEAEVELRALEQLLNPSQMRAAGRAVALAAREFPGRPMESLLDALEELLDREGLDSLTPAGRAGRHPGRLARPRRHEIAALLNRLRPARFTSQPP